MPQPRPLISGMRPEFLEGYEPEAVQVPEMGALPRLLGGIANAPANALRNTAMSLNNLFGTGDPRIIDEIAPADEHALPESVGFAQKAADFVGQGLAPMAIELGLTGGLAGSMMPARFPVARHMVQDALGFGLLGAQEDTETAKEQAYEGGMYGMLTALPRMARLPYALPLAAGSRAFFDRHGREDVWPDSGVSQGDLAGAAGLITSLFPGQKALRLPLADHFATGAKPIDPATVQGAQNRARGGPPLAPGGLSPEAQLRYRMGFDPYARGGGYSDALFNDIAGQPGTRRAADAADFMFPPDIEGQYQSLGVEDMQQRALQGRPAYPQLQMEGGVVQDYGNITLPEQQARVPQGPGGGRIVEGDIVNLRNPEHAARFGSDMQVLARTPDGTVEVLTREGPIEFNDVSLMKGGGAIPAGYSGPRPSPLWSPQVGRVLTQDMHRWGEQFGIAREQMNQLNDAFHTLGIRDNNLKVKLMWDMMRNELQNVEADFNPQKGKPVAFPQGLMQLEAGPQLELRQRMARASKEELLHLAQLENVKGKIGMPQAERQLLEAAQTERQRRAWQAQQLLKDLKAAQPFKGKINIPEGELQLAEQASHERQRQRFIHEANERLLASLRDVESPAQQAKAKVGLPEAQIQVDEQNALLRQAQNVERTKSVQQDPSRGKLSSLREWQRSEGGGALPELLMQIAKQSALPFAGASAGYAAGGPEGMLAGLAVGLTPAAIKAFMGGAQKVFGKGKNNMGAIRYPFAEKPTGKNRIISTAIRLSDDKLVTGEKPFDAHPTLLMEALDNGADEARLMENMGYMAEVNGTVKWVNRDIGREIARQAGQVDPNMAIGNLTSEHLREWEAVKPPEGEAGQLKPLGGAESGQVFEGLQSAMSRASLGFVVGAGVGGAVAGNDGFLAGGVLLGMAAAGGPTAARGILEGMANMKVHGLEGAASKAKSYVNLAKNLGQTIRDKAGNAMTSRATASDRFVRWLETGLGFNIPQVVKEALMFSKGAASALLDTLDNSLRKASWGKPPQGLLDLANKYLDGDSGMDATAFVKAATDQFANVDGHSATSIENYAKLMVTSREVVNGLQKMVASGTGDPKMAAIINDSIGHYLTRSYKLFTDPKWEPSQDSINKLVQHMIANKIHGDATPLDLQTMLAQYIREVKQTKGMYRMGEGKIGQELSQTVMKRRKDLGPEWKEFLGEITDPTERVYQTVFRLRPMAEASSYFSKLIGDVKEEGWLPHAFQDYNELFAFEQNLRSQADHFATVAKDGPEHQAALAKLEKFQETWKGQQNVDRHPKFGALKGHVVTRHVWDTLATYDNLTDSMKSPFLRGVVNMHTAIKLGRTALNPITVVRNAVTMPMFAAIAKVNPEHISEAWNIVMDPNHPLRQEIMKMGIGNVDQVKTEFYKEFEALTGGKYNFGSVDLTALGMGKIDLDLAEKVGKRGFRYLLDAYRMPDNLVRVGAYLSAKSRIAQNLGKAIDDPEVLLQATRFTNRYTMNYDAVSPFVKKGRNIPFSNLFFTYTAEMMRILKNLGEDVIKGNSIDGVVDHSRHNRSYAVIPLSTLAVLPELINSSSESSLSPQDQAEWEKVKKTMPDYQRTRYRMFLKREKNGNFSYQDFTPLIASDQLNQMVKAVSAGDFQAAVATNPFASWENTPILNIAREQMSGEENRTGRKFRGQFGDMKNTADRLAAIGRETLPPWFPPAGSEWQKLVQASSTNAEGTSGLTNLKTGVRLTPAQFLQPYLTGVRGGEVNPAALEQRAISDVKREMANETTYLNDVLNSDLPQEKKDRAVEVFRTLTSGLREKLRERLEIPPVRQ